MASESVSQKPTFSARFLRYLRQYVDSMPLAWDNMMRFTMLKL